MTSLGPHADFIIVAYVAAIVVIVALIVWVWVDYQAQRRMLGDLEKRGAKRRSHQKR
jgi:heme exporter protein D